MKSPTLHALASRAICTLGALFLAAAANAQISTVQGSASRSEQGIDPAAVLSSWPTRPLRIVVGFAAGSSPDLVARTLAEPLRRAIGQPVIVENHPGASGNIAAAIVASSTDEHTIGMLINGNMTIAKVLNPATPYDPQKDLAPISLICTAPLLLAAPADAPGADPQALLAAARTAGDAWSYGTPGVGTIGHLGMELLKAQSGITPVHVPYLGNPQVIAGLAGGQIQLALLPPGLADVQIRAGRLRAVGVTSATRSPLVPSYPALSEVGIAGFQLEIWTAAAAPATMPAPIVARLSQVIGEIVRSTEVRQKLFAQGYQAVGSSSEVLAERVREDTAALSGIIKRQGLKLD